MPDQPRKTGLHALLAGEGLLRRIARQAVRISLALLFGLILTLLWVWSTFAILYSNLPASGLRAGLALLFGLGFPVALAWLPNRKRTLGFFLGGVLLVLLWWLMIHPSNDRDWSPDQVVLPAAEIDGDRVTVRNIRNCSYITTTDYTVRHYDRTFDLNQLEAVYFVVEPFAGWRGAAHTFLSFGFAPDEYLAVSVEIRKKKGDAFSAWKGLFKQYEIMYVIGDERDLIQLRSNIRRDTVYVYPVRASRAQVRALLLDMLARANHLRDHPEFYNTLTNACATNIIKHVNRLAPRTVPYGLDILFPGFSDQRAYDLGLIDTELPFEEARRYYRINERALRFADSPDFSVRIRQDPDQ